MTDGTSLKDYSIVDAGMGLVQTYTITLDQRQETTRKGIGLALDFNKVRDVRKVNFSESAPDFREAKDGLNWIAYCMNGSCQIFREMFLVNRRHGRFIFEKEVAKIRCPNCRTLSVSIRNLGFVNCRWQMSGKFKNGGHLKSDGMTYDAQLYTF